MSLGLEERQINTRTSFSSGAGGRTQPQQRQTDRAHALLMFISWRAADAPHVLRHYSSWNRNLGAPPPTGRGGGGSEMFLYGEAAEITPQEEKNFRPQAGTLQYFIKVKRAEGTTCMEQTTRTPTVAPKHGVRE